MSEEQKAKQSAAMTGRVLTDAHKEKLRAARARRIFSPETRAKMSAARKLIPIPAHVHEAARAARQGKPLSEHAKLALKRRVSIKGVEYASMSEAACATGLSIATIDRRILSKTSGYETVNARRTRRKRTPEQCAAMRVKNGQRVIAAGCEYPSMEAASEALGITRPAVAYRIKAEYPGYARLGT